MGMIAARELGPARPLCLDRDEEIDRVDFEPSRRIARGILSRPDSDDMVWRAEQQAADFPIRQARRMRPDRLQQIS